MTRTPRHVVRTAAVLSAAIVAPLLALELRHPSPGPVRIADVGVLFGVLWTLAFASVLAALPLVGEARAAGLAGRPFAVAARAGCVVMLAGAWLAIVVDQWPCFMGVPNCD